MVRVLSVRMRHPTPLKRAIFESGRVQREIASELGMDPARLSRIVNGLHCDDGTREKIAAALERNVSELWPGEQAIAS